jgi:hypothetical protein
MTTLLTPVLRAIFVCLFWGAIWPHILDSLVRG